MSTKERKVEKRGTKGRRKGWEGGGGGGEDGSREGERKILVGVLNTYQAIPFYLSKLSLHK